MVRLIFPQFSAEQMELCVHLTRILLPGADLLLCRRHRLGGAAVAADVSVSGLSPVLYNVFIIVGGVVGARRLGIASLAYGALAAAFVGPFLINAIGAARDGLGYRLRSTGAIPDFASG